MGVGIKSSSQRGAVPGKASGHGHTHRITAAFLRLELARHVHLLKALQHTGKRSTARHGLHSTLLCPSTLSSAPSQVSSSSEGAQLCLRARACPQRLSDEDYRAAPLLAQLLSGWCTAAHSQQAAACLAVRTLLGLPPASRRHSPAAAASTRLLRTASSYGGAPGPRSGPGHPGAAGRPPGRVPAVADPQRQVTACIPVQPSAAAAPSPSHSPAMPPLNPPAGTPRLPWCASAGRLL